jgi:hypothetical protein
MDPIALDQVDYVRGWTMTAILIACSLPIYFLPWLVAVWRSHRNTVAIFLLNLFLGWALVGWVAAFVWAVLEQEGGYRRKYGRQRAGRYARYDDNPFG